MIFLEKKIFNPSDPQVSNIIGYSNGHLEALVEPSNQQEAATTERRSLLQTPHTKRCKEKMIFSTKY